MLVSVQTHLHLHWRIVEATPAVRPSLHLLQVLRPDTRLAPIQTFPPPARARTMTNCCLHCPSDPRTNENTLALAHLTFSFHCRSTLSDLIFHSLPICLLLRSLSHLRLQTRNEKQRKMQRLTPSTTILPTFIWSTMKDGIKFGLHQMSSDRALPARYLADQTAAAKNRTVDQ